MKYLIVAKFLPQVVHKDLLLARIEQIFADFGTFSGVRWVSVTSPKEGADISVVIEGTPDALNGLTSSRPYQVWLAEFGQLVTDVKEQIIAG